MTVHDAFRLLDQQLAAGRFPGYAVGIRHRDEVSCRVNGTLALDSDRPVRTDTIFRIASLSKIVGGVLALTMVADGVLRLDDEVGRWLPELAEPRVLRTPTGELTDTVPAERPILVRHLLNFTAGIGLVPDPCPIQQALTEARLAPGPLLPPFDGDEYLARAGALPLAYQPGSTWLYHCSADLLGVLLARAAGQPLSTLLAERVTCPLGMHSTAFCAEDPSRLTTHYIPTPDGLRVFDQPDGRYARPPAFESLAAGLVSTVDDYLSFLTVFSGTSGVLDAESARLMTTESITPEQRAGVVQLMGPGSSWGLCIGLDLATSQPWMAPGRFGWNGGAGTSAYVDPSRELASVLLTPRMMLGATGDFDDFYRALAAGL
jgi:CubicO group peptidase (beta-lactamase class C family)